MHLRDQSQVDHLCRDLLLVAEAQFEPGASSGVAIALDLARRAHAGQRRKHGAPYLVHPVRVALILLQEFQISDPDLVVAAVLHDVLEDAPDRISPAEIESACGGRVLEMIRRLTSPSETEVPARTERNRLKARKVATAPRGVQYVKLADRIDNLRDATLLTGPTGQRFRARYYQETMQYYLPIAERLHDPRVLAVLFEAIERIREKVMSEGGFFGCFEAAGVEVDFRRMCLPADLEEQYGARLDVAFEQMQAVEGGETVNVDEGWQVGHYWLRNAELAPPEHGPPINSALRRIHAFWAEQFRTAPKFLNVLWIGIGGSGLGPQMLCDALGTPGDRPTMFFFDNTDPSGFARTLREIELAGGLKCTLTVVVSKSGGTKETRNGMLVAQKAYEAAGLKFEDHAVAITKPGSKLDKLAGPDDPQDPDTKGPAWLDRFPIWDFVGGRTSLFSAVGMLPAKLLGLDGEALRMGARAMDAATRGRDLESNLALLLAVAWYHAVETLELRTMVVLPYSDRLVMLPRYLQQLVMESLGKQGKGITVFGNKGSTDQHAYVQQLREGYRDFFVTFIRVLIPDADWEVEPEVTCGDYLEAYQEGTAQALSEASRFSLRVTLERLNEYSLGALVALFERAVGYYGAMLGINAYHQPGVEAGKRAADEVISLQSDLISQLRSRPGEDFPVSELARQANADPVRVHDILDRLARAGRFGLRRTVLPDAPDVPNRCFRVTK